MRRLALVVPFLLVACDGGDRVEIGTRRVVAAPRVIETPTTLERLEPGRLLDGHGAPTAPQQGAPDEIPLRWETPPGWQQLPSTALRLINFGLPGGAECYVTILPGGGGGGLLANVNRWRNQLGAPPLDDAGLAQLPRQALLGNEAVWFELQGTYAAPNEPPRAGWLVLGLLMEKNGLVTVKLTGPLAAAEAQRDALMRFAASLAVAEGPH